MLKTYPAVFHIEKDGGYYVTFPQFKGAIEGDSLDEAMLAAKDFLASFLAFYIDEGLELPIPADIHTVATDNELDIVTLIQADPEPYIRGNKTVRKNVTVPEWLVKKAENNHINFSQTLTDALKEKLEV